MKARYNDIRELLNEYPYASGCLDEIDIDGLRTGDTLVFTDEDIDEGKTEILFKIQDFCLLYTSPSPRDQLGSRMPSSA